MKRSENRQGGGEQGEGGRKEDRGGRRKGLKRCVRVCVCVLCPWQQWTHTEERDWRRTAESTPTP